MSAERKEVVKEELQKLPEAQVIREYLANHVLVNKSSGKWRMYFNFSNLNKACPRTIIF
jgi:hypothetical protein